VSNRKTHDPDKEYTYEEKLMLVSKGLMDPKEVGVTGDIPIIGQTNAQGQIAALPPAPTAPTLGPWITFEATPVPPDVRAMWAGEESKIVPFDVEKWREEHKGEHLIQCILRCGNVQGRFEQLFKGEEPGTLHRGFVQMLRQAADTFEKLLNKMDGKTDEQNSEQEKG
jgi:hypothetical protein